MVCARWAEHDSDLRDVATFWDAELLSAMS